MEKDSLAQKSAVPAGPHPQIIMAVSAAPGPLQPPPMVSSVKEKIKLISRKSIEMVAEVLDFTTE